MLNDFGIDERFFEGLEMSKRAFLVGTHQTAVARDIRGQNSCSRHSTCSLTHPQARGNSSGSESRARNFAFPSHNGTPPDLASAKSSFSQCSRHSSRASRKFRASNVTVGESPISIVKM